MTTLGNISEQITFAGVDLASYAIVRSNLSGWDDFPPLRGENPVLTGLPGRQFLAKIFDSRRPSVGMIVTGMTAAGVGGTPTVERTQARTNLDALYVALSKRGQQTLTRKMPDATIRSASAEVFSVGSFVTHVGGRALTLVATFDMADPYFYGANVTDTRSIATSPTNFTLTNPGTAPDGYRITFDITGPCTNPRITNNTTQTYVEFIGQVASTKHLIVDCYAFTVTNDGLLVPGAVNHAGSVPFLLVASGANSITVSSSSATGASMTTTLTPAYL